MVQSKHVPQKCGEPRGPMFNRPSVEYTGRGNTIIFDGWGGRIFRSDVEDVKAGCEKLVQLVKGDGPEGGECANYNTLYSYWGIEKTDMGERDGWAPDEEWEHPDFVYTWLGPGTDLYDKFGEKVFLVEPQIDAFPYSCYWEV